MRSTGSIFQASGAQPDAGKHIQAVIEIDPGSAADHPAGRVLAFGREHEFVGWLGLMGVIDDVRIDAIAAANNPASRPELTLAWSSERFAAAAQPESLWSSGDLAAM
jgi:hypothetical protein